MVQGCTAPQVSLKHSVYHRWLDGLGRWDLKSNDKRGGTKARAIPLGFICGGVTSLTSLPVLPEVKGKEGLQV